MRPISVEFQAFGPYRHREMVNFEELSSKGLFLICGETGSGKTMILDAITYALYGKSSGSQREDLQSARCKNAQWGEDTFINFIFEANGKKYSFERRLECKRSNLSVKQSAYIINDEGIFEPLFENCKDADMRKKAQEIIGMDYEQFRQVILLPQGQFEKLLTADSSEKEQVLVNIFGVDKWSKIAAKCYEIAEGKLNGLKKIKEQIKVRLMDEECQSVAELENKIALLEKELAELNKAYDQKQYDIEKARLEEVKALLSEENKAKMEYETRIKNKAYMDAELETKRAQVLVLTENYAKLNEQKSKIEQIMAEIVRFQDKRKYYKTFEDLNKKLSEEKKKSLAFEKTYENKKKQLNNKKNEQSLIGKSAKELNDEYTSMLTLYINGIVGGLAKELEDGQPCPVCGSTEHPRIAKQSLENVSKAEVDKKKKEAEKSEKAFESITAEIENLNKELLQFESDKLEQTNRVKMAEQEVNHAKEQLLPDVTTIEQLDEVIGQKNRTINEYNKELDNAKKMLDEMRNLQADFEGKIKNVQEENERAELKYKQCVAKLNEYFDKCNEREDINICNQKLSDIDAQKKRYTEKKAKYELLISSGKHKIKDLCILENEYSTSINQAEEDWTFAKSLRGDTGIGLQRYVLGVMFSSVIVAANKMLEKVHGGRYRLYRTDEKVKGSNKKGLELFVYDSFAGSEEGRSVKTLSGGEKFLVSLALSIGLSTVARRSGIRLDAMFIDEGFGSLDQNSIEDAMDILMGIQKSNGVVGIISHVQLLKDNIPTKLEIVKTREGSRIIKE